MTEQKATTQKTWWDQILFFQKQKTYSLLCMQGSLWQASRDHMEYWELSLACKESTLHAVMLTLITKMNNIDI